MSQEERLRRALRDHAQQVPEPPDRWSEIEAGSAKARRAMLRRGAALALGAAAAALAVVLVVPALQPEPVDTIVVGPQPTAVATPTPPPAPRPLPELREGSQPLWPFASGSQVRDWEDSYRNEGTDAWHLDADQTALRFTTEYLGFTEIDKVIRNELHPDEAWVSVGYDTEADLSAVGAVVHLLRFGSGPEAPWEVVGTRDTTLSLTTPRYGSTVSSPVTVGGRISGVDENIDVQVRQISSREPLGTFPCCLPAGGQDEPWSATVSFEGATDGVVTIVVFTGGHLQDVERFAITGVRVPTD